MSIGEIAACLLSAMAGIGVGVVIAGMMAAARHDDIQRQLARLSDDDARRRDEVARLNVELTHLQLRDAARPQRATALG